jgi:hypothetical protein
MAPVAPRSTLGLLARRALVTAGSALAQPHLHHLGKRGLSVNHTQGVTLGVIGAYVVIIAILWNVPYIKWVLWPFKVCFNFPARLWPALACTCSGQQLMNI